MVFGSADAEQDAQAAFEPPPDDWDWVQLTSDEWLKGELIAFYDVTLEFDSDNLGLLEIDWDDVRRLRTHGARGVAVDDADPLYGVVEITAEHVIVRNGDEETAVDRSRLISIAAFEARGLAVWRTKLSAGVSIRKGNSDVAEYNLQSRSRRLKPRSRIDLNYIGSINETDGIQVANKHRFVNSWDLVKSTRTFWRPIFGQYYRDPFQNIEHQASVGGGYGWHFIDTSKTNLDFSVNIGGLYVWYVSALPGLNEQEFSPALGTITEFDIELTDWLDYLLNFNFFFLNDGAGGYKHHLLSKVSTDIWRDLDFDVTIVWDRTQRPQPEADGTVPEKDDLRLIVGLGWDF